MSGTPPAAAARLPRAVVALGVVSLLTDASSEMIFPLLPAFLATIAAAPERALGLIEGVAEATAAGLKVVSGRLSDRLRRRKPLVVLGYIVSSLARPAMALALAWPHALLVRVADRVGKGVRTSPRDAIIAAAAGPGGRGRAYGFHRALDNAGAVIGPLAAAALLGLGLELRAVFALTLIPGLGALAVLALGVREPESEPPPLPPPQGGREVAPEGRLGRRFAALLAVFGLFNLAASSDTFLLLRARELGVGAGALPLLWALSNAVRAALATAGGALSDRVGRRRVLLIAWSVYALGYLGFALARTPLQLVAVLLGYSLYYALAEGVERALIADLAPPRLRGRAFGWFHAVLGLTALPASVLFGLVWQRWGAPAAFTSGAVVALVSTLLLPLVLPRRSPAPAE